MAIVFNCPHCQFAYRLADSLAGKQAKCKNPECRKLITIPAPEPAPVAIPEHLLRGPSTAMVQRLADEVLNDEGPKAVDVPVQEKVIPMTCTFCDHKWTEPWSKAGKNTLCPNPECRQRQKVPEPKEDVPTNWRDQKTKLPSLAKGNFDKLEGVQDAGEIRNVSGDALIKSGAIDEQFEPRPLKQIILLGVAVVGLLGSLVFGGCYWRIRTVEKNDDRLLIEAREEFDKKAVPELSPVGAGLSSAVLNAAAAEYALDKALEQKDAKKTKESQELFDKARNDVRKQPPGLDRNAVAGELAFAVLAYAGTDDQVKEQLRYRWQPDDAGRTLRLNERSHTIHQELSTTLQLLQPADFEYRITIARRLARELVKRGQAGMAADLLPVALFSDAESNEARAVIALEIYRSDKASPLPRQIAEELKTAFAAGVKGNPYPASAQTLFTVLAIEKAPVVAAPPAPNGPIQTAQMVLAQVGTLLLDDTKQDAAVTVALRASQPEVQLKALTLCAEWSRDPSAAFDAALAVIAKKQATLSPSHILRLSQLAAISGKHEQAKTLADALADDGLKAWAKGDAARLRIVGNPKEKADENWVDLPDDPKKVRAGHAWGRLWVARANAKESHNRDKEKKATANWPPTVRPFALAGIALGLQDK